MEGKGARFFWVALARSLVVAAFATTGCTSESSSGGSSDAMSTDAAVESTTLDGGGSDAGSGCNIPECLRPYDCRFSCGGPVVASGCCSCAPPSFDDICCRLDACP